MFFSQTLYFMLICLGKEGEHVPYMHVLGRDQRSRSTSYVPTEVLHDRATTVAGLSYGFPDCGDHTQVAQFVHKVLFPPQPSPCPFHLISETKSLTEAGAPI